MPYRAPTFDDCDHFVWIKYGLTGDGPIKQLSEDLTQNPLPW